MSTDSITPEQPTDQADTTAQGADPSDVLSVDEKVKNYIDGWEYEKVIVLLREHEGQAPLTEKQLRSLAFAHMMQGKAQEALAILERTVTTTAFGKRIEGWCYLDLENWDDALRSFEKALELENHPGDYHSIGLALLQNRWVLNLSDEERHRLSEILEVAVSQEGCFPECFGWLDDIRWIERYGSKVDPQRSIEFLEQALNVYPGNEHLIHNLSRWFIHKDNERALSILKPTLEGPNPSGPIYEQAIGICEYLNNYEAALAYFEKAEEKNLVEGPGEELFKGRLLIKLGRLDEALKAYDKALNTEKDSIKFHALFGRSLVYLEKGNKYIALRNCTEAVDLWWGRVGNDEHMSDSPYWVWCWFASSYYSNRNTLEYKGTEIIKRVIASLGIDLSNLRNEFNVRLRYLQCLTQEFEYLDDEQKPDIKVLERIVDLKPTRTSYYRVSEAYKQAKNYSKALEAHLRYCVASYKESKTFYVDFDIYDKDYNQIALNKLAQKHAMGIHKTASSLLDEFTDPPIREAVFRPFYDAFWEDLLYAKKMYKELREIVSKLLEQYPDDIDLLWDYAYCSYDTGHINDAERAYRKLITLSPEHSSALHNLALIVEKKGAIEEALELSNKAAATAPNDENTNNLNERLKKKAAGYQEAKEKWDALDYFKRKILRTLTTITGYKDHADLAARAGVDIKYMDGHLRRLKEQQWIVVDAPDKYHLNEYVHLLAKLPEPPYMRSNKTIEPIDASLNIPGEGKYELIKPLMGYKKDIERQLAKYPFAQNVFLMMKFRESNRDLGEFIIENLAAHGLRGVRADLNEWNITKNVYNPIAVLYCCKYGIALFDEAEEQQAYSPNVAYELGIMHYQKKDCLILRHASLPSIPFDLVKDLYVTYTRDLKVKEHIKHWIEQVISKG